MKKNFLVSTGLIDTWEFEENNPGSYFRNNCWWWRSLWDYTYNECKDILTEKDWESGHYNNGHIIFIDKSRYLLLER